MLKFNKILTQILMVILSTNAYGQRKVKLEKGLVFDEVIIKKGSTARFVTDDKGTLVDLTDTGTPFPSFFEGKAVDRKRGFIYSKGHLCRLEKKKGKLATATLMNDAIFNGISLKKDCDIRFPSCGSEYEVINCNEPITVKDETWVTTGGNSPNNMAHFIKIHLDKNGSVISGILNSTTKKGMKKFIDRYYIKKYESTFEKREISKFKLSLEYAKLQDFSQSQMDYSGVEAYVKYSIKILDTVWENGTGFAFDSNGYINHIDAKEGQKYKGKTYEGGFFLKLGRGPDGSIKSERIITPDMKEYQHWYL